MTGEGHHAASRLAAALRGDPRTHGLGVRVEADGDGLVLRGEVASGEQRLLLAQVAAEHAQGLPVRNEVSVTGVLPSPDAPGAWPPPDAPDVLPLPEETALVPEVPPPRRAPS